MKIKAHVIALDDHGDTMKVKVQGRAARAPKWQDWDAFTLTLPMTDTNKRTYHLGRRLTIEVKPAGRF